MNKKLILSTVAAAVMFFSHNANALSIDLDPYVGADFTYSDGNLKHNLNKTFEEEHNNLGFVAGLKTAHYFMGEVFLERSFVKHVHRNSTKYSSNNWAAGVDFLGYYPVYKDLDLIGGFGIGKYMMYRKELGYKSHRDWGHGFRFIGGAEWFLDANWGIRATYRYIKFNNYDTSRANEYSIGVRYHFN